MITTLTSKAKDNLILVLQDFFRRNNGIVPIIQYGYAQELVKYPVIIVTISNGSYKSLGIGMDYCDDVKNACGYTIASRSGFMARMNMNIKIVAMTTEERQRLLDETLTVLLIIERDNLYKKGIRILGCGINGEEVDKVGEALKSYSTNITIDVMTETYRDELTQYIKSIDVSSHNGTTVAEWPELNCEP